MNKVSSTALALAVALLPVLGVTTVAYAGEDESRACREARNDEAAARLAVNEAKDARSLFRNVAREGVEGEAGVTVTVDGVSYTTNVDVKIQRGEQDKLAAMDAAVDKLQRKLEKASDRVAEKCDSEPEPTPTPTPEPTPEPTTPPAPEPEPIEFDCSDFPLADGTTAQDVLNRDVSGDPHKLDLDSDGVACETEELELERPDEDDDEFTSSRSSSGGSSVAVPVGGVATGGGPA